MTTSCRTCRHREAEVARAVSEIGRLARLLQRTDRPSQRTRLEAQLEAAKEQKRKAVEVLDDHECAE